MNEFMNNLKIFTKLRADNSKDEASIEKQANYLLLAKHGLAAASRLNNTSKIILN
jgi:site-specific DNA-adenine methylase